MFEFPEMSVHSFYLSARIYNLRFFWWSEEDKKYRVSGEVQLWKYFIVE